MTTAPIMVTVHISISNITKNICNVKPNNTILTHMTYKKFTI